MVKACDMIGDIYLPADTSREVARGIAGEMRQILNRDLDEVDIAFEATLFDRQINREHMLAAWGYLDASERRAWKIFLDYDRYVEQERIKNADQ